MKYFPLFQVFVFFTKIRIFRMCSYISHMLNHFRCEPLKNVFCFVRNILMLDDAMNSVYSGKDICSSLLASVWCGFFFWYIYVSVSAAIKCCSQSYVFVGFFLFGQSKLKFTNSSCMLVFHWLKKGYKTNRKPQLYGCAFLLFAWIMFNFLRFVCILSGL